MVEGSPMLDWQKALFRLYSSGSKLVTLFILDSR